MLKGVNLTVNQINTYNMKKLLVMSGLAIIIMASCKKKEEPMPPPPPPVEDPAPPPAPKPMTQTPPPAVQPPPAPAEDPDGTSVSVGSDGISVKNKKGDAKNNVTISKKKTEMEIRTDN